jgi:ADP-heptose:LPS heptosyltransferase
MRLGLMRWVDHWVGLPLCAILGMAATAARRFLPKRRPLSGKRPIAVFKFFGLGSMLEATPLLRAIRRRRPDAPLIFVTFDSMKPLASRLGLATHVLAIRAGSPLRLAIDCLRAIFWMRSRRVEAVVDLEFFSRFSTLLAFLCGARIRIGYHLNDFWRRSLVTHPIYYNCFRHVTEVFEQAGRQLDVPLDDHRISRLEAGGEAARAARSSLRAAGWQEGMPILGVNVNAGELCHERRWPLERFAGVVRRLLEERGDLFVVLTGAPSEKAYTAGLLEQLPAGLRGRTFVAAGAWDLDALVAGLELMAGFLTNDTGPMHLAAAQGTPTVSLWGPARPAFIAPRTAGLRAIYADYWCSPCVNMFTSSEGQWCGHQGSCMLEIREEEVLDAVRAMLDERREK